LNLAFADSPLGGGKTEPSDASERRSLLLQKARSEKAKGPGTGVWVKSNRLAMTRAYSPPWFIGRMALLKALWHDLNPPQVSAQLALEF
jgi:hypothetical protein